MRCVLFLCFLATSTHALSVKSHFDRELSTFAFFADLYQDSNGDPPKSWENIESISYDTDWNSKPYQLRKRIAFVQEKIVFRGYPSEYRVIAITRDPFRPQNFRRSRWTGQLTSRLGNPSYAVFVVQDGRVSRLTLPANKTVKIFADADAKLPKFSGLGPYPHEIDEKKAKSMRLVLFIGGPVLAVLVLLYIRKKPAIPT